MLQRPSLLVMPVSGVHIDLDQLEDLETSQFTLVSTLKPTLLVVVGICSYSLIHEDPDFLTSSCKIRPPDLCRNTACRSIQNLPIKHSKSGGFSYSIDEIVRVQGYYLIQTSPHFTDRQLPLHPSLAVKALLLQISRLTVNWPPFVKNLRRELLSNSKFSVKTLN